MKLTIDNSVCQIEGLNGEQYAQLKGVLSYTLAKDNYRANKYKFNAKRYLIDKHGRFPTGLLYLVKRWLKYAEANYTTNDLRIAPRSRFNNFKARLGVTPYPEQEAAAEAAKAFKRGIIVAPTGTGKSLMIALIIEKLAVSTLIVVPSLELKDQLVGTLRGIFGKGKVAPYGEDALIEVANVDQLNPKIPSKGFECVIIDEFHHSAATTYRKLNRYAWKDIYYRFGLTATPFRNDDGERLLLESVLSKIIYQIDYKTAVEKKYIVPMEAYFVEIPPTANDFYSWPEVYRELVVNNEFRNKYISKLLTDLWKAGKSTLCIVKEIEHIEHILREAVGANFVHGQDEESRSNIDAFNELRCRVLIGTTGILGEGIDTKPAEFVVIAGLGKSKNAFMQQCGRAFRMYPGKESAKIIIFKDTSHKFTLTHYKAQCKVLKEQYGVVPTNLFRSKYAEQNR